MRSSDSTGNGGRPRLPSGMNGAICATKSAHGTTRSISSRNSRRRVRFVDAPNPRLVCFMGSMVSGNQAGAKHMPGRVMQTFPSAVMSLCCASLTQTSEQQLCFLIPLSVDVSQKFTIFVNFALEAQSAKNLVEHHGVRHAKSNAYKDENARFAHCAYLTVLIASITISWAARNAKQCFRRSRPATEAFDATNVV